MLSAINAYLLPPDILPMGFFKKYECGYCGMKFKSETDLTEHGRMHLYGHHEHFTCMTCGALFHSKSELAQHSKNHN